MLRIAPSRRRRLIEIIRSLSDRINEATDHGWLGEAEGPRVSLDAACSKLAALDRAVKSSDTRVADLGIPQIRKP